MKSDFATLIDSTQQFLRQQEELYGSELYREDVPMKQKRNDVKKPQHSSAPRVAKEPDIFSNEPVAMMKEGWQFSESLLELNGMICACEKCPLGATRKNFVFGVGNPNAQAVIIGEAPGADEDEKGEPFVGRAGQLLNKILEAINFAREDVFICNILKCRPPMNRDPLPGEVEQCEPYLHKQLDILKPKIILALGRIAGQTLLRTKDSLTQLRMKTHTYHGIPLIVTYHPAAILRNPNWKRPTWEDVKKFRAMYDELIQQ